MSDSCYSLPPGDDPRPQNLSTTLEKPVEIGMAAETKDFYRKNSWDPWEEWTDQKIGIDGRSSLASAKYALIVRLQSPLIKDILGPVFEGYSGINTNLNKLEFKAPFREFYYRWDDFNRADPTKNGSENLKACSHFKLLANLVHAEIKPHIEQVSDLLKNGVISFEYVWALFDPDIEVFTKIDGHDRLFHLRNSSYSKVQDGGSAYVLNVRYIDTDGDGFGYRNTCLAIWSFENLKPILELEVIPSRLCADIDETKARLVQRGRVFENLKGINHRTYTGTFDVELIQDISWNSTAFDQLVLPHDYKRIIHAFAGAQLSGLDNFDDVIKGKGRGMIMLLSGEPGTGKTLTAESVAEIMQKPLYSMSAAELGYTGHEVEEKLGRALELSNKWGAVLLLDECDVFLECRTPSDIKRNTLVAIFLRLLEYYQGVMFMTTNRVSTFDPAFESRIHLAIHYPNLDHTSRLHIWKTFASIGTDGNGLSEAELDELAQIELNGRQIKNVVKTARLLAIDEKVQLTMSHINTVLRIKKGLSGGL
ncbi:hypothetical protein F53441_1479 [Fusarium austroafricanum]|uniref:AAA+ ATPase domain-containing protein n=1 Tax=Fusarium austroafricanum TaxID=2364996 RepID=A0A8H4KVE6_9HYPO|nr:hypothetical protein F53441_1479 [Fusarium austroafricanum]